MELLNPCKYSFFDLMQAAGELCDEYILDDLYALSQSERNNRVKILCDKAKWYWKDVMVDGITYTAFSPKLAY